MEAITILYWHWWVLLFLLLIIEMLSGTYFFLLLGAASALTGIIVLLADATASTSLQIIIFSALSVLFTYVWWKKFAGKSTPESSQPQLNKAGQRYIGQSYPLYEGIANGRGKLRIHDSLWDVDGEDASPGTMVIVTNVVDGVLKVKKIDNHVDA